MITKIRSMAIVALAVMAMAGTARAQVADKKSLTLDGARKVIAAAEEYAKQNKAPGGVIAVVDAGGNLMALERLDGTFPAGANISIGKARTAVLFQKPTKVFEDIINKGRTAMAALPDSFFTPLQGGIPVVFDGQIIGGVGVSGAMSAAQDEELAIAGAAAAKNFGGDPKMTSMASELPVSFFSRKWTRDSRRARSCSMVKRERGITWCTPAAGKHPAWSKSTPRTPTFFTC
jgi:glc operon protein GlcG